MSLVKRGKHGVSTHRVDKAYEGYTLFCPLLTRWKQMEGNTTSKVYLMDMNGNFVHYWEVPGLIKMHADLLPNGHILCSVDIKERYPENFINVGFNCTTVMELDWDSNIVWEYDNMNHDYHDRCRLKNGNTIVNVVKEIRPELQAKIKGGLPGSEVGGSNPAWSHKAGERPTADAQGKIYTLVLTELNPQNEVVWEMDLSEALDPELDVITPLTGRSLWPGLNSIEELPDGNLISTSYNLSQVYIWDKETKKVKWRFGQEEQKISFPHDPHGLENGNILFFDNGRFHSADPDGSTNYFPPDFSRVIEINPETNKIEWEYRSEVPVDFYSTYISSCQRLPNGNTFICEGATGRFFEVTQNKEIVWEYLSPFYTNSGVRHGKTNCVFRAMRYPLNYPGLAGKIFDMKKTQQLNQLFGAEAMYWANKINS